MALLIEKPRGAAATGFNQCDQGQFLYLDSTSLLCQVSDKLYPMAGRQLPELQNIFCQV